MKNNNISPAQKVKCKLILQNKKINDFAEELGMSRQALHQILSGQRVTATRRRQIADAVGLKMDDLWPKEVTG